MAFCNLVSLFYCHVIRAHFLFHFWSSPAVVISVKKGKKLQGVQRRGTVEKMDALNFR